MERHSRRMANLLDTVTLTVRSQPRNWFLLGSVEMSGPYIQDSEFYHHAKDWFSPVHGVSNFILEPSVENAFKMTAFPTAYATASYFLGVEGFMTAHIYIVGSEMFIGAPMATSTIALLGSALVQREVWHSIGDDKTGAVHFAAAGTMSGGSMPVVHDLPSRSDWEVFLDKNFGWI